MPGAGCRVPGAGCRVPGAGCRVPGAGCRVPGAGCRAWARLDRADAGMLALRQKHRGARAGYLHMGAPR